MLLEEFQKIMNSLTTAGHLTAAGLIDDFSHQFPAYRNHKGGETKAITLKKVERLRLYSIRMCGMGMI